MCAPNFAKGPFDVILELAGTTGAVLPDEATFSRFLSGNAVHCAKGGIMLLCVFFDDSSTEADRTPYVCSQRGPVDIRGGGKAWITYEVAETDRANCLEHMRRTVKTEGVADCPPELVDRYTIRYWTQERFFEMLRRHCEWRWAGAWDLLDGHREPLSTPELRGEIVIGLRRV
jgi:hypothetical protein